MTPQEELESGESMAEPKDRQVMVNMEETFHEIIVTLAQKLEMSASGYLRGLAIQDLKARGLITEELLMKVLA